MHDHELGTVAERTILTPAERAVLVEQAQGMQVALAEFIKHCKEGTSGDAIKAYVPVAQANDYMTNIISTKIGQTLQQDHDEGREH